MWQMMKVILLTPDGLGDTICSLIVANAVYNTADVTLIVPRTLTGLFDSSGFREYSRNDLPEDSFDLLIDLASNKQSRRLVRQISAREKIGRARGRLRHVWYRHLYHTVVEKYPTEHIIYDYKPILNYLNIPLDSTVHLPHTLHLDSFACERTCPGHVCIHIGARGKVRYIPVDLIVKICRYFADRRIPVRLIGTERDRAEEIRKLACGYPTYEQGDLSVVKKWLSDALLTIAPDSGIFHLASALGGKTLGIYGPKPYSRTGSINPNATAIEGDCACQWQKRSIRCPYDSRCLREIPFEVVTHKIETLLQSPDAQISPGGQIGTTSSFDMEM